MLSGDFSLSKTMGKLNAAVRRQGGPIVSYMFIIGIELYLAIRLHANNNIKGIIITRKNYTKTYCFPLFNTFMFNQKVQMMCIVFK